MSSFSEKVVSAASDFVRADGSISVDEFFQTMGELIDEERESVIYEANEMVEFQYLVTLRDSGVTNMWGANSYLIQQFGMTRSEAKQVLVKWIQSFRLPFLEQPKDGRYSEETYDKMLLEHAEKSLGLDKILQEKK